MEGLGTCVDEDEYERWYKLICTGRPILGYPQGSCVCVCVRVCVCCVCVCVCVLCVSVCVSIKQLGRIDTQTLTQQFLTASRDAHQLVLRRFLQVHVTQTLSACTDVLLDLGTILSSSKVTSERSVHVLYYITCMFSRLRGISR